MGKKMTEVQKAQKWITNVIKTNRLENSKNHSSQKSLITVNGEKKTFVIERRQIALNTRTRHNLAYFDKDNFKCYISVVKREPSNPEFGFEQMHITMLYRFSDKITNESIKKMSEFLLSK